MTRTGWAALAVGIVLYATSWWIGSPELATAAAAILVVVVFALLFLLRHPALLVERRIQPVRVGVGGLAEGFVTVTNTGRSSVAATVCQDHVADRVAEVVVPRLGAGRSITVPYPLPTERRAVVDVGPLDLVFADPFGIAERRVAYGGTDRLYVHPRLHAVPGPHIGRRVDLDAEAVSSVRGDADFHALRDYLVGDDLRRIHWKATAHRGTLMVREQVDPVRPDTTLVLDARAEVLDPDQFELGVEVVASILVAAVDRGYPVQLTGTAEVLRPARTADRRGPMLDLLAGIDQHRGADLDPVLGEVLRRGGGRSLVVVTGAASSDDLARLTGAGRRFQEVVVVVVAPIGEVPAPPRSVELIRVADADEFVTAWRRR